MTTPGGVSNLPVDALTPENLEARTRNFSTGAMKARAAERYAGIFSDSTGGNPASNITPLGVLNSIFASAYASIANADPADIQGPEDIPDLWGEFIDGLPVEGQYSSLAAALRGEYEGEDPDLLEIQAFSNRLDDIEDRLEALEGGTP